MKGVQTSASFNSDVTVALTVTGDSNGVEVPSTITIPAGMTVVEVTVKGIAAGKVRVTAALPQDQGGDTASLDVEVKGQ